MLPNAAVGLRNLSGRSHREAVTKRKQCDASIGTGARHQPDPVTHRVTSIRAKTQGQLVHVHPFLIVSHVDPTRGLKPEEG